MIEIDSISYYKIISFRSSKKVSGIIYKLCKISLENIVMKLLKIKTVVILKYYGIMVQIKIR